MEAGGNSRTGFGKSCCDEMIAGKDVSEEECLSLFILFTPEFLEHREMAFEALPDGRIAFSDYGNDLAEKRIADVQPLVLRRHGHGRQSRLEKGVELRARKHPVDVTLARLQRKVRGKAARGGYRLFLAFDTVRGWSCPVLKPRYGSHRFSYQLRL
jgi:hypothetical protein